jgi:hypothetical protein
MKAVSLLVVITLGASPAFAQHAPIRASIEKAAEAAAEQTASKSARGSDRGHTSGLFWSGVALGIAGVTTSALGLTAFRSDDSSTGNAPKSTYAACVAQKNSDPVYATNQCGVLKGKNLKLLWGGVALGGAGAALMIGGRDTSAELSPGTIGVFHRWHF